jgi:hypothetical protein
MRTLLYTSLIIMALVLSHPVAQAEESRHRQAAAALLTALEADKTMQGIQEQLLALLLQQHPQLAPQRDVFQQFLTTYLSWESRREEMITLYTQEFTADELQGLTAFYQTPLGKKALEKLPQLATAGAQLGIARVQAHQGELQQMLEDAQRKPQ